MRLVLGAVMCVGLLASTAHAATIQLATVSGGPGGGAHAVLSAGGGAVFNFNLSTPRTQCLAPTAADNNLVVSGNFALVNGSLINRYRDPNTFVTGGAVYASCYLTTSLLTADVQLDFGANGITGLAFIWGSLDEYNSLTVTRADGSMVSFGSLGTRLTGTSVADRLGVPLYSNQAIELDFTSVDRASVVTLSSSNYAFEIDGLNYQIGAGTFAPAVAIPTVSAVPEPGAAAVLFGGMVLLGAALRTRRRD